MKIVVILLLVVLGIYWLFDHSAPLPLNHDQFGLHEHNVHRMIGIAFLVASAFVWWKWKVK